MRGQGELRRAVDMLRGESLYLRGKGIAHASVVGSLARGTSDPASDLDVLIEPLPEHRLTIFDLVEIEQHLANSFGTSVDIIPIGGLRPRHRSLVESAVRAF
jgi:predicted nucleotidyltransferase